MSDETKDIVTQLRRGRDRDGWWDYDSFYNLADEAADEIARLRGALAQLQELGELGMKPDYKEWIAFHDKVAQIAREALKR